MPLSLTRTYIAWDYHSRAFGVAANHSYDICPAGDHFPYTYADAVFRHDQSSSEFFGAQTAWNGNGGTLTLRNRRKFYFPDSYNAKNCAQGAPTLMQDAPGHRIERKRDNHRRLQELIPPSGYKITCRYDAADRIIEAKDDLNQLRKYSYDTSGHIATVSDARHALYRFEYAPLIREAGFDPWLLTRVLDGEGQVLLENKYFLYRVCEQKLVDGQVFHYDYKLNDREVLETTVTLPTGEKNGFWFREGRRVEQK